MTGNRGSDQLYGAGDADLLLGGVGHDWIVGGVGNDGLYGELGEDHLTTFEGDRAYGGDGEDVIQAGDLEFALISGGAGFDTIQFDLVAAFSRSQRGDRRRAAGGDRADRPAGQPELP